MEGFCCPEYTMGANWEVRFRTEAEAAASASWAEDIAAFDGSKYEALLESASKEPAEDGAPEFKHGVALSSLDGRHASSSEPPAKRARVDTETHTEWSLALTGAQTELASKRSGKKTRRKKSKKDVIQEHRGGMARTAANGDKYLAKSMSLLKRSLITSDAFQTIGFSAIEDTSRTTTGWSGRMMPKRDLHTLQRLWLRGALDDAIQGFFHVPYCGKSSMLLDSDGRCFAYRTSQISFLTPKDAQRAFDGAVNALLKSTMENTKVKTKNAKNPRGPHLATIMGYSRQYSKSPCVTEWHDHNDEAVQAFLQDPLMNSLIQFVRRTVEVLFPGVAKRFYKSAEWHKDRHGIEPHFGVYWNLCTNAMFQGQKRIHCAPHIDFKNIVGVCVLVVYQMFTDGKPFNHKRKSWLVLWEAGVVIELPPWVFLAYPSSLLHHWNVDIQDFKVVTTNGETPTPANSKPLADEGDGRATFVFFNQASMYQSSETGYDTLAQARMEGASGKVDFGSDLQDAMRQWGSVYTFDPDSM